MARPAGLAAPRPHLEVDPRQADRRRVPGLERALVPEAEVRGQVEGPEHLPSEDILVDTLRCFWTYLAPENIF